MYNLLDSADSKSLIPLSFLADAPAACDAASEPVQVASLVLFRRRCMEILDRWQMVSRAEAMFSCLFILVFGAVALCGTGSGQLPVVLKGSIQRNLFEWAG